MNSKEAVNDLRAGVSEEIWNELAQFAKTTTVPQGTRLVQAGVLPEHLSILNSGRAETVVQTRGRALSLGTMGPGRVFGLHAILSGETPHTTVTCLQDSNVTLLPREAFKLVLARHPKMYFAVVKVLSADLATVDQVLRQKARASRIRPGRKARVVV